MIYVITSKDGVVIGKECIVDNGIVRLDNMSKDAGLTHSFVDLSTFDATPIVSQNMADWQTAKAKGVDVALAFIGKQLGLE